MENENLSREELDYIHSNEFLEKFGDWEKVQRLEKLKRAESLTVDSTLTIDGIDITDLVNNLRKNYSKENLKQLQKIAKDIGKSKIKSIRNDLGINEFQELRLFNNDTKQLFTVKTDVVDEIGRHNLFEPGHIESLLALKDLIENSIYIGSESNDDGRKPELVKFHYFAAGIKINKNDFTAKCVFTENSKGEFYYDQSMSTIEKGKLVDILVEKNKLKASSPQKKAKDSFEPSQEDNNLSPLITQREVNSSYVYYDKRLINICQVPQLPYLDEKLIPTKETVRLVKEGKLRCVKKGQTYSIETHADVEKNKLKASSPQKINDFKTENPDQPMSASDEISEQEIDQEKYLIQRKIKSIEDEINNNRNDFYENEADLIEAQSYIERLKNLTDDDIKKIVSWKKNNEIENIKNHNSVKEQINQEMLERSKPEKDGLFSFDDFHPIITIENKETKNRTAIQPSGIKAHNIKQVGKLKTLSESNEVIEKIEALGFEILSTESRILIHNKNVYYDFDTYSEFNSFNGSKKLNEWDFINFIKNDFKLTKEMKSFAAAPIDDNPLARQNSNSYTNKILDKIRSAGIDVVTDRDEFNRILEQEDVLQKMTNDEIIRNPAQNDNVSMDIRNIICDSMKQSASKFVPVVYSRENYNKIFRDGYIESPIETVKLGQNQFIKLSPGNRNNLMLAIRQTIENPSIILEKETFDENSESFKPVHVYGKSFVNESNEHIKTVESIIVYKEGDNIAISLHNKPVEDFIRQIKTTNDIVYLDDEVSRVAMFAAKSGDGHVLKETEQLLSRVRQMSYSSLGQESYPLNPRYNKDGIMSTVDFISSHGIETGKLEINKDNFDRYFNILNQHKDFKNNRNKIASELFNYHVPSENKEEMKNWLSDQGYTVNEKNVTQFMTLNNGLTYGFVHDGKIYLNPEIMNSNAAVHEYTHLWDAYTRNTNPELWNKGLEIFRDTNYWSEVISDPNYQEIKDDENLVLSEIHSRICGDMAEKVLDRISKLDGEQAKLDAIDWDKETWTYVFNELHVDLKHAFDSSSELSFLDLKEFLSTPMKNLMAEKNMNIEINQEKKSMEQSKKIMDHKESKSKPYSFFVDDAANLDLGIGVEFEPVTGMDAKQAVLKYSELKEKGLNPYIGLCIPGDFIFNDNYGNGVGIFTETGGKSSFDIGDTFVNGLKENDEHAKTVIAAYKELYENADKFIRGVEKPGFVFDKEAEIFDEELDNLKFPADVDELTQRDIELCRKVIPPSQFNLTMELSDGEEGEFFKNRIRKIADIYRTINTDSELTNDDGTHNLGFRYFLGDTEIYISEIDFHGNGFGYTILNGDLPMSEFGYTSMDELLSIPGIEMDYHVPEGITIERMLYQKHPEYFSKYAPKEESVEQEKNASSYANEILDKIRAAGINVEISAEKIQEILNLQRFINKMVVDIQEFEEKKTEIEKIRTYNSILSDENKSLVREQEFVDFQTSLVACKKFIEDLPGCKLPDIKWPENEDSSFVLTIQKKNEHLVLTTLNDTLVYDFETKEIVNDYLFNAFKDFNAENNCCDILVKTINDNLGKQLGEQRSRLKKLMQENAILSGKALNELSAEETRELKERLKSLDYEQIEGIFIHKNKKIALTPEDYVKEVMNAKLLVDHNHTVYLLPENFAFRKQNEFGQNESYSTPDTLTDEEFVELKTTDKKLGARFGEAVEQANNVLIRIEDDISIYNARKRLQNKIKNLPRENGIEVKDGKLFLYFEKKGLYVEAEIKQGKINILPAGPKLADYSVVPPANSIISQAEELSSSIPKVSEMIARTGVLAGIAYDNNIILNPDYLSSNAAVHEYTHLWDAYTRNTNPELWNKGLEIFRDTNYWSEVISDPNYQDIRDDENLVLSEIHSRICGDMAEKVLDRISKLDGEQAKLDAIDWDKETWTYIFNELNVDLKHAFDSSGELSFLDLKEFLSTPMKDLMAEKNINIEINQEKKSMEQSNKIVDENPSTFIDDSKKMKDFSNSIFEQDNVAARKQYEAEQGSNYDSNLSTTDIAKKLRTYVKENYPEYKFSVTSKYFSGGSEINITLKDTPMELTNFETMKAYIEKHFGNFNQIWDEDSHAYTSYYELDEEGKNNFIEKQLRVMPGHSISSHNLDEQLEWMTPEAKKVMKDVVLQLESYNFDHSDSQSDYFHVNFWSNYDIDAAAIEKSLQLNKEKPEQKHEEVKEISEPIEITIVTNQKYQTPNLAFSNKPTEEMRNEMKAAGWIFNPKENVWWPRTKEAKANSAEFAENFKHKYEEVELPWDENVSPEMEKRIDSGEFFGINESAEKGMSVPENTKKIIDSLEDEIIPYVDLTDLLPENIITDGKLIDFLADIADSGLVFETEDNKFIGIDNNHNKIRHLVKGKKATDSNRRLRENRDKYLNVVEKIINNAVESKDSAENTKKEKKPDVEKYHYFRSYVKLGDKYFELRLDTEEKTDKKNSEMPAPVYISQKRMTNGKLNSPQNISLNDDNISNLEQKSIPLYLYDIFETKLSMQHPEEYLMNKMYRDSVDSGNIEKAKKILLQEAKRNGYDITPGNKEEISKITYDKDGFLIPLSKRFEDKSAIEVSKNVQPEEKSMEYPESSSQKISWVPLHNGRDTDYTYINGHSIERYFIWENENGENEYSVSIDGEDLCFIDDETNEEHKLFFTESELNKQIINDTLYYGNSIDSIKNSKSEIDNSTPELKTYHTLKKEDVENLHVISDEEFSDIVDSIILNDYKNIPNAIRLPNINETLAEKLGLEKDSAFILKKEATHIHPDRKGGYGQAFDTEEYRMIPAAIRNAEFAIVDRRTKNFMIVFDDKNEASKINKLVFNKDEFGNYLVTVGKVDRRDGLSEKENFVVGVGVAPTISALRFPEELPATRLRPSTTTIDFNVSQTEKKSSGLTPEQKELKWERCLLYSTQDRDGVYRGVYDGRKEYITLELKNKGTVTFYREPLDDKDGNELYSLTRNGIPVQGFEKSTVEKINKHILEYVNHVSNEPRTSNVVSAENKKEDAQETRTLTFEDAVRSLSKEEFLEIYRHISEDEYNTLAARVAELDKRKVAKKEMVVPLPSNTVDLTDVFDNKLKNQNEIAKYLKSLTDEIFIIYDNYKIGITPKDSKHLVYTNGVPYRSQKVRINNYLMNLEKVLSNAEFKGESSAKGKKGVESFYYFTVPIKVGNGLYTVQFDCKKNSDVVIAKEQSPNKLTDNNITGIYNNQILEISQVDCYLYNIKERVVTRELENLKALTPPSQTQEDIEEGHKHARAEAERNQYESKQVKPGQKEEISESIEITIVTNKKYNIPNLSFSSKPTEEMRDEMKAAGWLYNPKENVWWPRTKEAQFHSAEFAENFKHRFEESELPWDEKLSPGMDKRIDSGETFGTYSANEESPATSTTTEPKEEVKEQSQFDRELDDFIQGKLDDSHVFSMGYPGMILRSCGFPDQRIEMSASRLKFKAGRDWHRFDLSDVHGLDESLKNPVAVFEYGDRGKSQNVIVNLKKNGKNFLAGIHFNQIKNGFEISTVRTLFPKDGIEVVNWIDQGKMIYGDKEKILALIAQQRINVADVNNQVMQSPLHERCLDSVDSLMQRFGNVKDIFTDEFEFYRENKERYQIYKRFDGYYTSMGTLGGHEMAREQSEEFYEALKNGDTKTIERYMEEDGEFEISHLAREIVQERSNGAKDKSISGDHSLDESHVFTYKGYRFFPVRYFKSNEESKDASENTTWADSVIRIPQTGTDYSPEDFYKTAGVNGHADIFYCIEKGKFYTLAKEGVHSLNDGIKNKRIYDAELKSFREKNKDLLTALNKQWFNEEKDIELMTNIAEVLEFGEVFEKRNETLGNVRIRKGTGINANGILHIAERRLEKKVFHEDMPEQKAIEETAAILFCAVNNIDKNPAIKETNGRWAVYKNGIKTVINVDKNGYYIVTGFDLDETERESAETINAVNARYGYKPEFHEIYAQVGAALESLKLRLTQKLPDVNRSDITTKNKNYS